MNHDEKSYRQRVKVKRALEKMYRERAAEFQTLSEFEIRKIHEAAVRKVIGQDDVCSVCGDRPSRLYRQNPFDFTARLCSDCFTIRRTDYGEGWVVVITDD